MTFATAPIRTTRPVVANYYDDGFEAGACDRAQGYTRDNQALHSHLPQFA